MTDINKYLKISVVSGLSKSFIVTGLTLLLIPLIIKKIGLDNYGLIMLTLVSSSAVSIVDLGISKTVTFLIGRSSNDNSSNEIVTGALIINIILLFIISLFISIILYLDIPIFGSAFGQDYNISMILVVGLWVLSVSLMNALAIAILEGFYLMHFVNIGNLLSSMLLYGAIYLTTFFSTDILILISVPVCTLMLIFFFYLFIIFNKTNLRLVKVNWVTLKGILIISLKFLNLGVLNSIIIPANKYLLIFLTGNTLILGIFDISLKIAISANNLLSSLSGPLFGIFSNSRNVIEKYRIVKKTTLILFTTVIIGSFIYYFAKDFIANMLDENNGKIIADISFILLIGLAFSGVSEPVYKVLLGSDKLKYAFYLKLTIPILNILFYIIFYSYSDLLRVTYAMSLGFFFGSIIMISYYFQKQFIDTIKPLYK